MEGWRAGVHRERAGGDWGCLAGSCQDGIRRISTTNISGLGPNPNIDAEPHRYQAILPIPFNTPSLNNR